MSKKYHIEHRKGVRKKAKAEPGSASCLIGMSERKEFRFASEWGGEEKKESEKNRKKEEKRAQKDTAKEKRKAEKEQKRKEKRPRRKRLLVVLACAAIAAASVRVAVWPEYSDIKEKQYDTLASISDGAFHKAGNTVIYDKDNRKIGSIGNEKYYYVKISSISKYITKGYVSKEDKKFYTHHGVDWMGTLRAFLVMVKNLGHATQGGSTITQQLVKNCLLTQTKTYERKILEILAAKQVEKQYTKAQIMEFYCNSNYYGNGCYGVEGASRYYFGKKCKDLDLAEAAMLVATSNRPNAYNPVANYSLAMKEKKIVIEGMLKDGIITSSEARDAIEEKPEIVKKSENTTANSYLVTYAVHEATLKLMAYRGFHFRYTFASQSQYKAYEKSYKAAYSRYYQQIRTGGYTIKTSFDQTAQKKLQKAIDSGLAYSTEKQRNGLYSLQGAATVIDNRTQMVIASVGGREEKGEYNRSYQAIRQPGSAIKPLLDYAPAINEGVIYPGTVISDTKTEVGGFKPQNYDKKYHGDVTARDALVHSYNIPALKIYQMTGRKTAMSYLDAMKFANLTYTDSQIYPVSIGGFTKGVSISDMARGYATLENGGSYSANSCILKLSSFAEGTVFQASSKTARVFNQDTSFILSDMLEGTFASKIGYGYGMNTDGQHYAAKTGTTNDSKDLWVCGYSKYYTTALWIGYDYPRTLNMSTKKRLSIWLSIMNGLHSGKTPQEFTPPATTELRSTSGSTKKITYTKNIYSSRPEGWDYMSGTLESVVKQKQAEREEKARISAAEKAVSSFETYQIDTYEKAAKLSSLYNSAYDKASAVSTQEKREEFLTRLNNRYKTLSEVVKKNWTKAEEAYNASVQAKKDAQTASDAKNAASAADESAKSSNISAVESYITALNAETVYSSEVDTLIENADKALAKCTSYSEYSSLKSRLEAAEKQAKSLPSDSSSSDGTDSSGSTSSSDMSGNTVTDSNFTAD